MKKVLSLLVVLMVSVMSFGQYDVTFTDNNNFTEIVNVKHGSCVGLNELSVSNSINILYTSDFGQNYVVYSNNIGCGDLLAKLICRDSIVIDSLDIGLNYIQISAQSESYFFIIDIYDPTTASTNEYGFDRTEMRVFPSPTTTSTTVRFFADKSDVSVQVFSLNGILVFVDDKTRNVGSMNDVDINLTTFNKGFYIVKAGKETQKLIIE